MNAHRSTEVFYTTDSGFVTPTLASIASLRRWHSSASLPINVVLLGMNEPQILAFQELAADLAVRVHEISKESLTEFDNENFNKTHVPYSALARFLIPSLARTDERSDILYVDGDTWFMQDPKELLDLAAPQVGLLACEDQSFFYADDFGPTGKLVSAYFDAIGLDRSKGYFNSGVIKCRASEWTRLSGECLSFLRANLPICRYHDQSALNAVAGGIRTRLSPVWNFQTPYWGWNVTDIAEPKLLHFIGGLKPWMGTLKAWSAIQPEYSDVIRARSHRLFPLKYWNDQEQLQFADQERRMALKNRSIFLIRVARRRARFRNLVRTAIL
ncbi:glycosyltransferase [Bradyrhizobium sp. NP1]|uniref:glycosyltransferase family 8 protein n=1 Tax=Bradyrhizobium sp. NP1 TaxID=3049772 RepID=UPI0025A5E0E3|nr:glycosyltransferase [Bradyrhizobium sp. NP1]WJR81405.1 glycosyltransferase [Bradyrhizobium sp. NP1]